MRTLAIALMMVTITAAALAADFPALNPRVQWLETERLRGVLFHDPTVEPLRPRFVLPPQEGGARNAPPLTVVGESLFMLLPDRDRSVACEITGVSGQSVWPHTLYALFDGAGQELATGVVAPGKTTRVAVAKQPGVCTLLVNSGPGSRNTARVKPLVSCWCLDGGPHSAYDRTPLHLHFLRDLKLGGFNVAMIDFERYADDFLTPAGLKDWTAKVKRWCDYAKKVNLRVMPTVNLGGSGAEVRAWEGCRPGLYIEHLEKLPLAPCPLDRRMWEQVYLSRARVAAELSRSNPCVVGFGLDPEMYAAWKYGHYMMSGTCFCDTCLGGFLKAKQQDMGLLTQLTTGQARYDWLQAQKLYPEYDRYLENEMAAIAGWCRNELHKINPDFLTDMFVTEIGNWFCRGIARGFGQPGVPTVNFAEHTYYGVGFDPQWLGKITQAYRDWGAEVLQGSAVWDVYFPATEPRFFAAHAYNLVTKGQGYWHWPGDNLYRDWGCRFAYLGKPSWHDDFWPAAVWAHQEADRWLKDRNYRSPLDQWEPVPWKGKYKESEGGWQTEPDVLRPERIPAYPVHVPAPAELYFRVRPDSDSLALLARCRNAGESALLKLYDPQGAEVASAEVAATEESAVEAGQPVAGVWRLGVAPLGGAKTAEVMLTLKGPRPLLASDPRVLPEAIAKPRGLIGYWKLDEGKGESFADSSPPPPYPGAVRTATWTTGKQGSALAFDGRSSEAVIIADEPFHKLKSFSLCAWVKLNSLSQPGNGRTIVNKGPESPVQHFWWWIGYPPNYQLTLEMGNEKHQWGTSFATGALQWETGRWYHLAVTCQRDGDRVIVCHYRDGKLLARSEKQDDLHSGAYDLRLGSYGGLHFMDGVIDEIRLFSTTLTAEQVAAEAK
ncbi:LamG domain-containing protein [bacterium]|nr:LamG domain-containing protein [bacterium]